MIIEKGSILEVEISYVAFGGKGIAKPDGFTIFVDQTIPGDIVKVKIIKKKKRYADAIMLKIIKPSINRITPLCKYSGSCGGCNWQFIDYNRQLEYKRAHIKESIEHIGQLKNVTIYPVIASENIFKYRNKMEFACSDKRMFLEFELNESKISNNFAIGFHIPGTFSKIFDVEKCLLQPPLGNNILNEVRQYIKNSDKPVYGLKTDAGFWRFLILRYSFAYDEWMINIITAYKDLNTVKPISKILTDKFTNISSVVNNITKKKAWAVIGDYEICLYGTNYIKDCIGKYEFEISANSFFQTNTKGAAILYKVVKEYAALTGCETVVDLYCGTGTISIFLSSSAKEVIGFEISRSAVKDAQKSCRRNNILNCRFISGDIKKTITQIKNRPDVLIIDPPRIGMNKDVALQVLCMEPEKIIYVSCNPSTLARDLKILCDKYRPVKVQPVDMFPHTYHIESVTLLLKK